MSANPPADAEPLAELQALTEAEREGRSFLLFRDRDNKQRLFLFAPEAAAASVGRRQSSDLLLDWDKQVSRLHARFERIGDGWEVTDDGLSSNGTFINGERLTSRRRLNDGDVLRFGTTAVTFHSPGKDQAASETEAGRAGPSAGEAGRAGPSAAGPDPVSAPAANRSSAGAPQAKPVRGGTDAVKAPEVALSTNQRRVLAALCRPYRGQRGFAVPATDEEIARELVLSVGEVRAHLNVLYAKLGIDDQPHGDPRVGLAEQAFSSGLIKDSDL